MYSTFFSLSLFYKFFKRQKLDIADEHLAVEYQIYMMIYISTIG